mgnify:CR=1 FL=1
MFGLSAADRDLLRRVEGRLERLEVLVERLDVALTVRDPGNARSAEAYDGLRKTVAAASSDRRRLTAQLVEIHDRVTRGTSNADLASLADEWTRQAGLTRDDSGARPDAFDVVSGEGEGFSVVQPAWIDDLNQSIVRRGQAERVAVAATTDFSADPGLIDNPDTSEPTETKASDQDLVDDQTAERAATAPEDPETQLPSETGPQT